MIANVEEHVLSSLPPMPRPSTAASGSSRVAVGSGIYRRTISRSTTRSARRRKSPLATASETGNEESSTVLRDSSRQRYTDRARATSLTRPPSTTVKYSRSRVMASRAGEVSKTQAVHAAPRAKSAAQKRPVTSNDILIYLYNVWQPQLCSSYRKPVPYYPTDPLQMRAFMDAMLQHRNRSPYLDKFKAVGRVAQVVAMLRHPEHVGVDVPASDITSTGNCVESRSSSSRSGSSINSNLGQPSLQSSLGLKKHMDALDYEQLSQISNQHPGYSQSFRPSGNKLPYYQHRRSVGSITIDLTPKTKHQLLLKSHSDGNFNTV